MGAIDDIDQLVLRARVAWLAERPEPDGEDPEALVDSLRAVYRYHRDARERLEEIGRRVAAMVEDCEIEMSDVERWANELKAGALEGES